VADRAWVTGAAHDDLADREAPPHPQNSTLGQYVGGHGRLRKCTLRLVVTAPSTRPIMDSTTPYSVTSASAINAGPQIVPPGRNNSSE
jgi:hypothetical protein